MSSAWAKGRRGGFTLVELLVVITIILIVSAVALPTVLPALAHRQVSEAARTLQGALAGARDAAIRDNSPAGIRLLPDPNFTGLNPTSGQLDGTLPLAYNRIIPIESAPEYQEGFLRTVQSTSGFFNPNGSATITNTGITYPALNGGAGNFYPFSVLMVVEEVYNASGILNPPTSWFWNIRVGDKIQIGNSGPWYTVIGPMVNDPSTGNSELFVNVGLPGTTSPIADTQAGNKVNPEFLFLVNGQDDNQNGWVDEGWDGVDNNLSYELANKLTPYIDDLNEWGSAGLGGENEQWLGSLLTNPVSNSLYTIQRRPIPTINAREVSLPSGVVIDATSWAASLLWQGSPERTRVPTAALNIYSGVIDVLINPDGSVVPTTIYSSSSSLQMDGSFYHFWLAERSDIYPPTITATGGTPPFVPSLVTNYLFTLPMPYGAISQSSPGLVATPNAYDALVAANPALPVLKGEVRIVTLFTRSGQLSTNDSPTFNVLNVSQPFFQAQEGVSGGQQ